MQNQGKTLHGDFEKFQNFSKSPCYNTFPLTGSFAVNIFEINFVPFAGI